MSGILSGISSAGSALASFAGQGGILGAIAQAGQLFGGYGTPVTLGPVTLQNMQIPERVAVGGRQATNVIKLPGGQRVIQTMGRDDADMTWTGYFEGPGAEGLAQQMDSLRQAGQPIQFAFGTYSFTVVVSEFLANYERSNWIPYSVTVTPLQDNAASLTGQTPSLLDSLNSDINSAAGFDLTGDVASLASDAQSAISFAQPLVNAAGALGLKTSAWTSALSAVNTASTAIGAVQAASEGTIGGFVAGAVTAGNMLGVPVQQAGAALGALAGAASALANSSVAAGFMGRTAKNLSNASA